MKVSLLIHIRLRNRFENSLFFLFFMIGMRISIMLPSYSSRKLELLQYQGVISTMSIDVCVLFAEIRPIFRQNLITRGGCKPSLQPRIEQLLETLTRVNSSDEAILSSILFPMAQTVKLKELVMSKLLSTASFDLIKEKYSEEKNKEKQTYSLHEKNWEKIAKEFIQNSRLIEEELLSLRRNLETLQATPDDQKLSSATHHCHHTQLSLATLLKILRDIVDFQEGNPLDDALFRLSIIDQSLSLLLLKSQHVLHELSLLYPLSPLSSKSHSGNTKRSALSQSIEIFKHNQKKLQQEKERAQRKDRHHQNQKHVIKTDYQLVCKTQKKINRSEAKTNCCFGRL